MKQLQTIAVAVLAMIFHDHGKIFHPHFLIISLLPLKIQIDL